MSYRSGYGGGFNTGKRPPQKSGERYSAVPPPSSLNNRTLPSAKNNQGLTKHGYTSMEALSSDYGNTAQYGLGKRKGKTEDE